MSIDEQIIAILEERKKSLELQKSKEEQIEEIIKQIKEDNKVTTDKLDLEMEQHHFFNKSFSMYMPKYFEEMSEEHVNIKYPNANRPKILYTDSNSVVDICLNLLEEETWTKEQVVEFRNVMATAFLSTSPSSKIFDMGQFALEEEIPVAYYAFDSYAIGGSMYNLIFITLLGDKILIVSMNCPQKEMEQYELLFYGIMHTTTIEKELSP